MADFIVTITIIVYITLEGTELELVNKGLMAEKSVDRNVHTKYFFCFEPQ